MLVTMVFGIMLGMGASLRPSDFLLALRRPHGLGIGLLFRYGFMPLIGLSVTLALDLPRPAASGVTILSGMRGGATANVFA